METAIHSILTSQHIESFKKIVGESYVVADEDSLQHYSPSCHECSCSTNLIRKIKNYRAVMRKLRLRIGFKDGALAAVIGCYLLVKFTLVQKYGRKRKISDGLTASPAARFIL